MFKGGKTLIKNKKGQTPKPIIIEEFLKEHDNFSLVEEKQLFANEGPRDGLYYVILKKD